MSTPAIDTHANELEVRLPQAEALAAGLDQDQEWCEVELPGGTQRMRFHDYDRIFRVPGLYERLFYQELKCCSPTVVRGLLESQLDSEGTDAASLRILDLGAGNGMVAEELREMGAASIVGVDILPEAAMAAERDRPDVYDAYHVSDLTAPLPAVDEALLRARPELPDDGRRARLRRHPAAGLRPGLRLPDRRRLDRDDDQGRLRD